MAHFFTFDMRFEGEGYREEDPPTEEDHEELKKTRESIIKALHEEDIRSNESIPDSDDDEQDFQEIKDPRQDAAATAHAVNKVLEELIQSTASKKICDVHHLDRQILTKVLGNLKDSIAQETLNQLQLPASKKICYAHNDDEKSLKNLITQETSINLHNVSDREMLEVLI
ncbi:hypothetical protein MtrunA17_Chr5g0438531 [Medicago truncatula]|uniref:Uncharacterized protein n=1 Tax=Medicago truncatula TaxID=3880 RepID=A0A396I330_MEDTR|nr:hypothetical protein MtrunA17_Chr5g0438531 [Medicago truncatula]